MVGQSWSVGCNFLTTDINSQEVSEDLESISLESKFGFWTEEAQANLTKT